jgi:hypothetical protein
MLTAVALCPTLFQGLLALGSAHTLSLRTRTCGGCIAATFSQLCAALRVG